MTDVLLRAPSPQLALDDVNGALYLANIQTSVLTHALEDQWLTEFLTLEAALGSFLWPPGLPPLAYVSDLVLLPANNFLLINGDWTGQGNRSLRCFDLTSGDQVTECPLNDLSVTGVISMSVAPKAGVLTPLSDSGQLSTVNLDCGDTLEIASLLLRVILSWIDQGALYGCPIEITESCDVSYDADNPLCTAFLSMLTEIPQCDGFSNLQSVGEFSDGSLWFQADGRFHRMNIEDEGYTELEGAGPTIAGGRQVFALPERAQHITTNRDSVILIDDQSGDRVIFSR